jgi:hypothetical protein
MPCTTTASATSSYAGVPTNHRMANRMRGQDQHPDTWPGLGRGRIDSTEGARKWVGHGGLAHNQTKIAALTA